MSDKKSHTFHRFLSNFPKNLIYTYPHILESTDPDKIQ